MSSALDLGKWGLAPARPSGTERKGNGLADTILKEIHSSVLDLKKRTGVGAGSGGNQAQAKMFGFVMPIAIK